MASPHGCLIILVYALPSAKTAVTTDRAVAINVRDTSIGIAEHELGGIFDEFARFSIPLGKADQGWVSVSPSAAAS
jgi:hypothetical protein